MRISVHKLYNAFVLKKLIKKKKKEYRFIVFQHGAWSYTHYFAQNTVNKVYQNLSSKKQLERRTQS